VPKRVAKGGNRGRFADVFQARKPPGKTQCFPMLDLAGVARIERATPAMFEQMFFHMTGIGRRSGRRWSGRARTPIFCAT
jgi:hypothetical protein